MNKFKIETISDKPKIIDGLQSHWGRITIGDFSERFVMPIDSWTLDQYKKQWKEGLERLKNNDTSCLVSRIENMHTPYPTIELWDLYKVGDTVFFQNSLLINETLKDSNLKLSNFNSQSCYDYINTPRQTITEDGDEISEWSISLKDFLNSIAN